MKSALDVLYRVGQFALIGWLVAPTCEATPIYRFMELQYFSGFFGQPNWSGELKCPLDYGIEINLLRIYKPCFGFHCIRLVNYRPTKLEEIRNNCTLKNTCEVKLWERTFTDGNNVVITYNCKSLLLPYLFANKMVKRFYHSAATPTIEYCPPSPQRYKRGYDDNFIGRIPPSYTFNGLVAIRMVHALNRVLGYYFVNIVPSINSVFQTIIMRTRPHPDGGTVDVPVYVAANLTYFNTQDSSTRRGFTPEINTYLDRSGIRRGSDNPDDGGHLVAYTLGGSDNPSNLVPMARHLNRREGIWYTHEDAVRVYLRNHPYGMVRWEVLMVRSVQAREPLRPIAFVLRMTYYEHQHDLSQGLEQVETFINENEDYRNAQCSFDLEELLYPSNQQDPSFD